MAPRTANSKKVAGNERKAAKAQKQSADAEATAEAAEAAKWQQGTKSKKAEKQEAEEQKREEQRRKKEERDRVLAEEDAQNSSKPANSKNKGRDKILARRGGIDGALSASQPGLSAHNIDDAISALQITTGKSGEKVDRHPERRFKPALRAYEEARLPDLKEEHPGLRLNQYKELMYKEFEKSPQNPFNQVTVDYNASREDVHKKKTDTRAEKEKKLAF